RPERRVVMLADREDVEPGLFGVARHRDGGLDALRLAGRVPRRRVLRDVAHAEQPELDLRCGCFAHGVTSLFPDAAASDSIQMNIPPVTRALECYSRRSRDRRLRLGVRRGRAAALELEDGRV